MLCKAECIPPAVSGSLRCQSIEATGLHLQQPVLPVGSGDTEVMDGAPQDVEGFSLQSELRRVGPQTLRTLHSYYLRKHPEVRRMSCVEGLRADSSQFTLEGEPFCILGGSIHYFRVPRAHWEDRLLRMKACGLNTLTTYVPWNLHEPEKGTFNFQDQLDLKAFINLAAETGLWVILRPGPYICAEWDLGGLPSWLLQDKDMQLRTTYPGFVNAVNLYFDTLVAVIKPFMFEEGGPIIAVQVENEYGSYAKDESYMPFVRNCLQSRGIKELLLTSDNWEGLSYEGMEGVLKTINLQRLSFGAIQHLAEMQPQKPLMVMEYWSGWFDVWGEHHHVFHAEDMLAVVSELLERGVSINLYMFHGEPALAS
ncbi:hypothetical protein F7725_020980 [Dissostichus mawsoni]|uniref:Glycoside hydrolase 35 catalytic domain-containing protein n=1 Tax=Dissostichus mawsoni TaxID=36200 RepID=A0A7J5YEQ6_DISMA|nr:hypothetical protein F7725_020980 [Dissostichus mawsoni]